MHWPKHVANRGSDLRGSKGPKSSLKDVLVLQHFSVIIIYLDIPQVPRLRKILCSVQDLGNDWGLMQFKQATPLPIQNAHPYLSFVLGS